MIRLDQEAADAWLALLLSYRWECFATLTFSLPERCPFRAIEKHREWLGRWRLKELEERGHIERVPKTRTDAYGRDLGTWDRKKGRGMRWIKKGQVEPVWVLGVERHKNQTYHLHGIYRWPERAPEWKRMNGWKLWHDAFGRAKLEPPRNADDTAEYVSKYVLKGGELLLSDSFNSAPLASLIQVAKDRRVSAGRWSQQPAGAADTPADALTGDGCTVADGLDAHPCPRGMREKNVEVVV